GSLVICLFMVFFMFQLIPIGFHIIRYCEMPSAVLGLIAIGVDFADNFCFPDNLYHKPTFDIDNDFITILIDFTFHAIGLLGYLGNNVMFIVQTFYIHCGKGDVITIGYCFINHFCLCIIVERIPYIHVKTAVDLYCIGVALYRFVMMVDHPASQYTGRLIMW